MTDTSVTAERRFRPDFEGGGVLVYQESTGEDGHPPHRISFQDVEFKPLGLDDLIQADVRKPLTIPLSWDRARVVETNIANLDLTQLYKSTTTLESPFTSRAIGLIQGGWLPSSLAATQDDATLLLDSNVASELLGRFGSGKNAEPDFLDLFIDQSVRINPLLMVMEGKDRRLPSLSEMKDRLEKEARKLKAVLPKAQILDDPMMLQGAWGLLEEGRATFARKQAFLLKIAPLLAAPVAKARRDAVFQIILDEANAAEVDLGSLVVIAALSVAGLNSASPATKILKFKPDYVAGDAYNALADLRALDFLISLFAFFPTQQIQLCTCDLPLAKFWVGLGAYNFRSVGGSFTCDFKAAPALLPPEGMNAWSAARAAT